MDTKVMVSANRARRRPTQMLLFVLLPLTLLLTSCKLSDITDPVTETFEDIFDLGSNEIHTPEFEIVNGIKISVVLRFDDLANGVPITVNVKCAGGTHASATVTLTKTGSVSLGQTTFEPGWPAGTDCVVSHELVTGIEAVEGIITWVDSNDVQATFTDV